MAFIIGPIIFIVLLSIIGIKYDKIIPALQKLTPHVYYEVTPKWFIKLNYNTKLHAILLILAAIGVIYSVYWFAIGKPNVDDLFIIKSSKVHELHENESLSRSAANIEFRTDDGIYLRYSSTHPNYWAVKTALTEKDNFTFLVESPKDSDSIWQISSNETPILSYKVTLASKKKRMLFYASFYLIIFIYSLLYLSGALEKMKNQLVKQIRKMEKG